MGICLVVADLETHPGSEPKRPAVFEFEHDLALQDEQDVTSAAPMVGLIPGRVIDDSDAHVAAFPDAPERRSRFSFVLFRRNLFPLRRCERYVYYLHCFIIRYSSQNCRWGFFFGFQLSFAEDRVFHI